MGWAFGFTWYKCAFQAVLVSKMEAFPDLNFSAESSEFGGVGVWELCILKVCAGQEWLAYFGWIGKNSLWLVLFLWMNIMV